MTVVSKISFKATLPSDVTTYDASSPFHQAAAAKIAKFLLVSRERTLEDPGLKEGLASMRGTWKTTQGARELSLVTPDGDAVNGLHFPGTIPKAIIHLHGNGDFYELSVQKPLEWREALTSVVGERKDVPHLLVFNPRGTGESEGVPHPAKVALDLFTAFEYLVHKHGIAPDDIIISGHSMGGYFGALGAALVQETYPDHAIHFLSDRSFASLTARACRRIEGSDYNRATRDLMGFATSCLMSASGWDADPIEALEKLKGRVCVLYNLKDAVIPYETSLHEALTKSHRKRTYDCFALQEASDSPFTARAHNRLFAADEQQKVLVEMKRMLRLPLTAEEDALAPLTSLEANV